ncbi:hypothetical protein BD309DRAFT_952517 [Dichomitus squalens]|nr:hypothetical protein BD309DRAFT_952517 [Dichomitus squalens]
MIYLLPQSSSIAQTKPNRPVSLRLASVPLNEVPTEAITFVNVDGISLRTESVYTPLLNDRYQSVPLNGMPRVADITSQHLWHCVCHQNLLKRDSKLLRVRGVVYIFSSPAMRSIRSFVPVSVFSCSIQIGLSYTSFRWLASVSMYSFCSTQGDVSCCLMCARILVVLS